MRDHVFSLLLTVLFCTFAFGQPIDLTGIVSDTSGAAVPNADVKLITSQQIVLAATKTDAQGRYSFDNVADGSYVVVASRSDFSARSLAVNIGAVRPLVVDLQLSINQLSEEVTITAETGLAEELVKIPQQINVVTEDSIRKRTTGVLAQVADEETGVSLQRTSPTIGAVLVRGLTEVGVYVDGIRYTNSTQRGGINTFFNLNDPSGLSSVEIQRSPNTAQFGSDGLGGNVQLLSRQPAYGFETPRWNGEFNPYFTSADTSFGGNALMGYGTKRFGLLGNVFSRRVNTLRPGRGIDSHSSITRFLGLPSNMIGSDRLADTTFTQYGANFQVNYAVREDQNLSFRYQRSQQDGGKRYDQLLGGDGNLIAELKNLMLDFAYVRYYRQGFGFFDNLSATVSYNSQREERINQGGQGNPLAAITNDKERTTSYGVGFFLDKAFAGNNFLVGADHYHDSVTAPSFSTDPAMRVVTRVRPRVPNGSTYDLTGVYVQDVFEAIPNRLRISSALRYNVGQYSSRAADAPVVNGEPLFPDDSARFKDYSGRIGATFTIIDELNLAFNFSRGFRAPNITGLGGLGLVGVGFQVSTASVANLGATIGSTADTAAASTGVPVSPLRSEISNNYDVSLRFKNRRFSANFVGFVIDYGDTIARQTLIMPQGAVGRSLGSQVITSQNANGAVFVPLSTSPVLVQANFGDTRIKGTELNFEYRFAEAWTAAGNHSYVHAADRITGAAPNLGGGGIPPQLAFLRLRYQPRGKSYWIEAYTNMADRQDRLSTLDIADRRTGGARTRTQIGNFFRRGACIRGLTSVGTNGQCGSAGGTLISTGETLAQVQNRVLPIGATVNGVLVVNNDTAVPLFTAIPGYALFNIRGGYRFAENHEISADFENIGDKSHRAPGWGIDGPGRSFTLRYQYRF
ncbi:MAG TPA: TonB-dependent receptor [Pyrinomonadaceae bacterium]|nr:TonB-dependent receptor [Pyrinomonadaceae bacterium]